MTKVTSVFSEFEVVDQYIKFDGDNTATNMKCVGTSEEELDVKIITKKCRGRKVKEVVKGEGSGKLKETLHVPADVYNKFYNMARTTLLDGVYAYGQNSTHPTFTITQKVIDEDGNIKLKAYPKCIMESGPKRKIENGAEEVAELEIEISLMPDEHGECMYECLMSELASSSTITENGWLTTFSYDLIDK